MAAAERLKGVELVDCAKANAKQGAAIAANLCGYSQDVSLFQQELERACEQMGIKISGLTDLLTEQQAVIETGGLEIAPETPSEL